MTPTIFDFKQGWKTSEFWLSVIPMLVVVLRFFGVDIGADELNNFVIAAGAVVAAGYAIGRSFLKGKRVEAVAAVQGHAVALAEVQQNNGIFSQPDNAPQVADQPLPGHFTAE